MIHQHKTWVACKNLGSLSMRSRPQWGSRHFLFFFIKNKQTKPQLSHIQAMSEPLNHLQPYCLVNLNVMWKDWIAIFRVPVTVRLWNSSIIWTDELFPTKLGMVVHHYVPQCWVSHVVWLPGLKGQVQVGRRTENAHISHILFFFFFEMVACWRCHQPLTPCCLRVCIDRTAFVSSVPSKHWWTERNISCHQFAIIVINSGNSLIAVSLYLMSCTWLLVNVVCEIVNIGSFCWTKNQIAFDRFNCTVTVDCFIWQFWWVSLCALHHTPHKFLNHCI